MTLTCLKKYKQLQFVEKTSIMLKKIIAFIFKPIPSDWRDFLLSIKRFWRKNKVYPKEKAIIFFTEKGKWHGGFVDRMKGIVSVFHFCLCKNVPFKINYTFPFELTDFLLPNTYDWIINKNEISFHRKEAKFISFIGYKQPFKRVKNLNLEKQIHIFSNRDITSLLNAEYGTNCTWGELFKKLFRPTEKLQHAIDEHIKIIGGNYISAVFRFQNLLGDFQEYNYQPVTQTKQDELIKKCKKSILALQNNETIKKILITSDSVRFLNAVLGLENIFAFPSKVVHIDCVENENNDVYMKSFLDFYLLSESEKIFSIGTDKMYKSHFPDYAAKINNIPFERILIE